MEIVITVTPHLEPAAMTGTGKVHRDKFEARIADRLLCISPTPFLAAARILLAEGADPSDTLVMRHAGKDHDALRAKIRVAAKLSVMERTDGKRPPTFVPFRTQFPQHQEAAVEASDENPVAGPLEDA